MDRVDRIAEQALGLPVSILDDRPDVDVMLRNTRRAQNIIVHEQLVETGETL